MNARRREVETRFAEETAAELPILRVASRGVLEQDLERIKDRLLDQLLKETPQAELREPLLQAANEAVALAETTGFPLLVLPLLLEEKTQGVRQRAQRPNETWLRSQGVGASDAEAGVWSRTITSSSVTRLEPRGVLLVLIGGRLAPGSGDSGAELQQP